MKIDKDILLKIYFFVLIFYIFTNFIYGIQIPILIFLTAFLIAIQAITRNKIKMNFLDFLFMIFALIMVIWSIMSPRIVEGIKFSLAFLCLVINFIIISKEKNIDTRFIFKLIMIFGGIHVLATLIYQAFPNLFVKILPLFLKGDALEYNLYAYNIQHVNCGLTPIQSANAMYITAFITIMFSKVLSNNKKIGYIIAFILGFIALLLTSKRGILVANIGAIIIMYIYYSYKVKGSKILSLAKGIIVLTVIAIIGYFTVIKYFPDATRIINRFTNQTDLTTGRDEMYNILLNKYKEGNIIIGNGLFYSREILNINTGKTNDAHNIYIQVLIELGIIGFIFFASIIFAIIKRIGKIKLISNNKEIVLFANYYIVMFIIYGLTGNGLFDLSIVPLWLLSISLIFNDKLIKGDNI